MSDDVVFGRLRALLGSSGVERDPSGVPRATPESSEALSLVCRLAHEEGWKIRVEGHASWLPPDAPADLAVSTRALDQVVSVSPADLVATVQAGAPLEALRRRLADEGMWLALDPPGRPDRTVGSVVASATAGPAGEPALPTSEFSDDTAPVTPVVPLPQVEAAPITPGLTCQDELQTT